jgi:hypothetical protein
MSPPLDGEVAPLAATRMMFPCLVSTLVANVQGKVTRDEFKALKSAVKVVTKRLNKDATTWIVGSAKELVDAVNSVHPVRHNINASYLRVTSSRIMRVLRLNGIEFLSGHCSTDLPDDWKVPVASARSNDERRLRCLMPLIRNLIRYDRKPVDVTQVDFDAYCLEVDQSSQRKDKVASKQGAKREWNFFAKHVGEWPKVRLALKAKRNDYLLPDNLMPPAAAEFDAMAHVPFRGNIRFGKRRRRLSEHTIKSREYSFRRVISAAVAGGIDPNRLKTKADVCELDVLETAFNFILDRNKEDVEGTCDVSRLSGLMYAVAEQWVGVTGKDLENHKQLCQDYEHIQQGMAEKNQRLLAQFTSDKAIAAFLRTPRRVMNDYANKVELTQRDCVRMQMAAAMAILTRVLIRMENLRGIEDRKHLIESGWGSERHVLLIFGNKEVKNDEYLETLLSPRVVAILDTYKQRAWPKLMRAKTNALFPGYNGKHKSASTFGPQLSDFVFQECSLCFFETTLDFITSPR